MAAGPAAQLGEDISQAGSGDGMKQAVVSRMLEKEREKNLQNSPIPLMLHYPYRFWSLHQRYTELVFKIFNTV